MFTLDEINNEVQNYNTYTSYYVPEFHNIEHDNSNRYFGEIRTTEIKNNKYTIHISSELYNCPLEYQKSVIWHETTHLYDILRFRQNENMDGIIKTYSESHAVSIQLRYLLHITSKQIVNQGKRFLIHKDGRVDLGTVTANYINQSIQSLNDFQKSKKPNDFDSFTNNFCYFCGYMMLKKHSDADKLSSYVISKFPNYKSDLQLLYESIMNKNFDMCATIYNKMKAEAMLQSFSILL